MSESLLREVYTPEFLAELKHKSSDSHRHIYRILVDINGWSVEQQEKLELLFRLAQAHGQLNKDSLKRLRSPNPSAFWGKLNEFAVAYLFHTAGASLDFSPTGRDEREGEFVAAFPEASIFVEVKTMFPSPANEDERRHLSRLSRAAASVDYPAWIMVQVLRVPSSDPVLAPFCAFVTREVPILAAKPEGEQTAIYEDPETRLRAVVAYQAALKDGPIEVSPFPGMKALTEDESVRGSLKKAYRQLPDNLPCLVILSNRLHLPPSPRLIRDALYGTTQVTVRVPDSQQSQGIHAAEVTRLDDGFFARGRNSRISAVGIVDEVREKYDPHPQLVIHHHPSTRHPVDPRTICRVTKRQELAERLDGKGGPALRLWQPLDPPWPRWDADGDDDFD